MRIVTLNNGVAIPIVGYGVFQIDMHVNVVVNCFRALG